MLIQVPGVIIRREGLGTKVYKHRGKTLWRYKEKVAIHKPWSKASEEINPADSLISDFWLQDCEKNRFLLFKHPVGDTLFWQQEQMNAERGPSLGCLTKDSRRLVVVLPLAW